MWFDQSLFFGLYFNPEIIHLFDSELPVLRRDTTKYPRFWAQEAFYECCIIALTVWELILPSIGPNA
jgi:hypothetical protein